MKKTINLLFFLTSLTFVHGQAINRINLKYLYDPANEVNFALKPLVAGNQVRVFYSFQTTLKQAAAQDYMIDWERRDSYAQQKGTPITEKDSLLANIDNSKRVGWLTFPKPEKPWLLIARITNPATLQTWVFVKLIEANYPVDGFITNTAGLITRPYVNTSDEIMLGKDSQSKPWYFFYYKTNFSSAFPAFSEEVSSTDKFLRADSTFSLRPGDKITLKSEGLYLAQQDTSSAKGFSFRVENSSYPKVTHIDDLAAPVVYVSTKDEYDQLINARGDKVKFDKVIIDMTSSTDRARTFMRNYFRRVELANHYFTSYKEGWKTDQGMIYLIFGLPDEVSRDEGKEIWYYKSTGTRFTFMKTGSVYDPDYYVLLRDKKFAAAWYSTIDLRRKGQF
jgi:GWxTD domain-containing protein